jgi:cytochrome bd-type quinol oxidase subunit 2
MTRRLYAAPASRRAPVVSPASLFYGGVVVLPVIAACTIGVYWVFRGRVRNGYGRGAGGGI